jgi:cytochrome b561/polyisoprenoid-binding protein YceI
MLNDGSATTSGARYTTVAVILHWLIAAALIFQVALGWRMQGVQGAARFAVFQLHKSVGLTLLLLVALRLVWRLYRQPPALTAHGWERALAQAVHVLFYALLFALPISGWLIVSSSRIEVPTLLYGTVPWPHLPGFAGMAATTKAAWSSVSESIHVALVYGVCGLFALHVAGALKHHLVDRDGAIARMVPGAKRGAWADPRLMAIAVGGLMMAGLAWTPIGPGRAGVAQVPTASGTMAPRAAATAAAAATATPSSENLVAEADTGSALSNGSETAQEPLSSWAIATGSTLRFRTSYAGEAINGGFGRFDGTITFSPDQLERSRVDIRIDAASAFSGDDQRDETLKSADFFSVASFATATFKASRFRNLGGSRFVAEGTLALKGVTLPVSVPFTLTIKGDKARMRGTATVDRTAYKIGEGDFAGTSDIPAAVTVSIAIEATRK